MLQRKQTLFLLAALILTVICLCLPLGSISPKMMGVDAVVYNLGIRAGGVLNHTQWPLMAILLMTCLLCLAAIFLYRRRRLQMKLCTWSEVLCAIWYVYFVVTLMSTFRVLGKFNMSWTLCIPLINIILYTLAYHNIKKDEELVRSADRIR